MKKTKQICSQMEPKRMAGGGDHLLPPEIWREVLTRASAESIFRCRFVCKSWYSVISSPNFISDHSIKYLNKSRSRVLLQLSGEERVVSFSSHDESFTECRGLDDVPEAFLASNLRIVGSCNGLICLSKYVHHDSEVTFIIWNPTIRKVVELPSRRFCSVFNDYEPSLFGFGFDSKTGDYKVLFVVSDEDDFDDHVGEIIDLRKGVWRAISLMGHSYSDVGSSNPECYLNGAVHWIGSTDSENFDPILLAFDMSDEFFREIRMPNCPEFIDIGDDGDNHIETQIVSSDGLIHVIVGKEGYTNDLSRSYSVWAMKEYGVTESWTKVFNIDLQNTQLLPNTHLCLDNFHLWDNGEILMVYDLPVEGGSIVSGKHGLALYNTGSRKCKHLFSSNECISNLCRYEETLALM